jgi:pyruvate dehydrogenase E1 component beta subunit
MAELTYRSAIARGIAQEMERDPTVIMIGEDVAAAGGVFKTTEGLQARFGPERVRDTPISEQAITGALMGAAMNGLRPIGELMFSDFLMVCWDIVANQIAKTRYMTGGQVSLPLVIRTANGGGTRFGGQHSQSLESMAMAVPGLKVVAPSNPRDVVGLMAAAVRDDDPVIVFEHKKLFAMKQDVPDGEIVDRLGVATVVIPGSDVTIAALAAMVAVAEEAARRLKESGVSAGDRPAVPGAPRHADSARFGVAHRPSGDCGGEPAVVWLGGRGGLHRGRGDPVGPRWPGGAGHHPAHSASVVGGAGRPGHSLGGARRGGGPPPAMSPEILAIRRR